MEQHTAGQMTYNLRRPRLKGLITFIAIVLCAFAAPCTFAQEATATIAGTVLDKSGAAIPEASVEVRNVETNLLRTTQSDLRGDFAVPALQPGLYSLTVSRPGFKQAVLNTVRLQVNQVASLQVVLEVGVVTESIDVSSVGLLVQVENSTVGQVVETRKIEELPLNGRQFLQLVTLVPGTVSGYNRDTRGSSRAGLNIAVSGGRTEFNNYVLDGVLNTDENNNTYVVSPSVDALQEFKVQTSAYSAQFGRGGAGQINIITRSGTNEYHGTVFEFLRNARLDAKNFFDRATAPIPPYKQNQFGGTFGGPVNLPRLYRGKDRTFFLFNYEGLRVRQATTSLATVPDATLRSGDFTGYGSTIFDPKSVRPDPNKSGGYIRDPFPGNRITSDRFDPTAQFLFQFLPLPNLPGAVSNYLSNASRRRTNDQYTARVDHQISTNNSLFGRYTLSNEAGFNPGSFPQVGSSSTRVRAQLLALSDTHVLGPRTVNEFKFGFNRMADTTMQANAFVRDISGDAGIMGLNRDASNWGSPGISVLGFSGWGDGGDSPTVLRDNVFQYLDNLSLIRGRHTINLGAEIRRVQFNLRQNFLGRGSYSFTTPLFTSNPAGTAGTGAGLADYLLGLPRFAEGAVGDNQVYDRRYSLNFYIQDDFKLSRRFTLNLGLRYEFNSYPVEKYDRIQTLDLSTNPPTIVRAGSGDPYFFYPTNIVLPKGATFVRDGRFGRSLLQANKKDFAPRVGIAYQMSPRTAVRTAYGVFYAQDIGNPFYDLARNAPRNMRASLTSDAIQPQLNLKNAFLGLSAGQSVLTPSLAMVDPYYPSSYLQHWTFNVQRELAKDLVMEAGYVGNKGTHLGLLNLLNAAPPAPGAPQPRRPWPMFERIFYIQRPVNSTYHSFQARVEKRFANGVSFLASYTFGKSLDYDSSTRTSEFNNRPIDPSNLRLEHGRSAYDARQNFIFSSLWELPFGPGKALLRRGGISAKVFGGWQLSGIFQTRTGLPFTVGASGDIANTGNDQSGRANVVPGQDPRLPASERTLQRWFNTAAFVLPPLYTFGNAGRNTMEGPGFINIDLSAFKNINFKERLRLQFRSEFFNATNTPRFANPGSGVNSSTFGRISSASASRQIQFALKLIF